MKEATGELNMTVITVIAIAAVAALFYAFVWPMIQISIATNTCKVFGEDYKAYPKETGVGGTKANTYECCRGTGTNDCVEMPDTNR